MYWTNLKPNVGDTRLKRYFAWLPVHINMRATIWLEFYFKIEMYIEEKVPGPGYKGTRIIRHWKCISRKMYKK